MNTDAPRATARFYTRNGSKSVEFVLPGVTPIRLHLGQVGEILDGLTLSQEQFFLIAGLAVKKSWMYTNPHDLVIVDGLVRELLDVLKPTLRAGKLSEVMFYDKVHFPRIDLIIEGGGKISFRKGEMAKLIGSGMLSPDQLRQAIDLGVEKLLSFNKMKDEAQELMAEFHIAADDWIALAA